MTKSPKKSNSKKSTLKIAIYGAGAIGGYLGVQLSQAGHDVTLIARGAHLKAMRENGLKLLIDGEEWVSTKFFCTDDPAEAGPQDYVIVTLKSHQAYDAAARFGPLLGPETAVVTAMNGVPWWYFYKLEGKHENHRLESVDPGGWQWKTIGPERAIGAVVYPATEIVAPGVIKHVYGNKFTLGEPDGVNTERVQKLSDALNGAGLKAPVRDNIRDDIWIKLWGNLCFNPISALTGATLDVVATDPSTRILSRCMMIEAQEIGAALGVHFRVDVHRRSNGAAHVGAHALVRLGHAVRSLTREDNPLRRRELAFALAYSAASCAPRDSAEDTVPEDWGGPAPGEAGTIGMDRLLSAVCLRGSERYLADGNHRAQLCTGVVAPSSLRFLIPHLPAKALEQVLASLIFGIRASIPLAERTPIAEESEALEVARCAQSPSEIRYRAACSVHEHSIVMAEACLREEALAPNTTLLRAAADAALRLSPAGYRDWR